MTTYFITGIDTDVGKTVATGVLASTLNHAGKSVITQKLIQTGVIGTVADDIITHRQLMGMDLLDIDKTGITCPLIFAKPASPHLSSRLENRPIDTSTITSATKQLSTHYDIVLLEGAGGVLVPITDELLTLDYVAKHNYLVILVTSARLGSINHTLLSLEAIQARGLTVFAVIFNHHFDTDNDISSDTLAFLQTYLSKNYPKAMLIRLQNKQMLGSFP